MRRALWSALIVCGWVVAAGAAPAQPSFIARADRARVGIGEAFVYEVTLSIDDGRVEGYRPPEFRNARVLSEMPSQSTQIQMGGGGSYVQTVYSWRYEIEPLAKGIVAISPARVRVNGQEVKTSAVSVTVLESGGAVPRPTLPQRRPASPFGGFHFSEPPSDSGRSFLRVIPSKTKAYVGEQVNVEWYLYVSSRPDKYQTVTEPRTDGFWVEEMPIPQSEQGLTRQMFEGREYLVAPLLRRAIFPLQPGRLTVTPMESEIAQVDFFGSTMRGQRLKADPVVIEAQPLPTSGQPQGFDPAAVGRFTLAAKVDRDHVAVGDAVTLTVTISGQGNVRKLPVLPLAKLDGWKVYDPRVSVNLEPGDVVRGSKTIEYLLLPERAGSTVIPAFTFPFFDPGVQSYVTERTAPLRLVVTGEQGAAAGATAPGAKVGPKPAPTAPPSGTENVLGIDIRPLRAKAVLRRDLGTTFYRSPIFTAVVVTLPAAFGLTVLVGFIRGRMSQDTEGARRRRLRKLVRARLGAAETHLQAGRTSPFFIEIDRVLRELLSGKLGRPVAGLSQDELRAQLSAAGFAADVVNRIIGTLEECDRARFAAGAASDADMRAALERAGEVILQIERARVRGGAAA